jgi:small subunit ribosomal protein S1
MSKDRTGARSESLQNIKEGQEITGTAKNITDYGVFLDLGGIDGLLHITDMTWGRLGHPSELCKVGDDLKVKVLRVDPESGKISLGLKQLTEDPWKAIGEKFGVGTTIAGKIVNITDYGAFMEMEKGIEGLIHISEMSWGKKIKHPSKVLALGDTVEAKVLDLDSDTRRISLGMKQALPNPWDDLDEKYPVGTKFTSSVKNITDFGLFMELEGDIDGLAHVSDLSWVSRWRAPQDIYKIGDTLEVIVLSIDRENERFSLGVKQLTEDPWSEIEGKLGIGKKLPGEVAFVSEAGLVIKISENVEGFVSIDQIPEELHSTFVEKYPVGTSVEAVVHTVDERDRKILLGIVDQ